MSECITKVFEFEDVTVEGVQEHGDGWLVTVRCGPPGPCARCGQDRWHRHGRGPRRQPVAHAGMGHRPIHLTGIPQRWRCAGCGHTQTPRPARWGPWPRGTPLAQTAALPALRRDSFPGVARGLGVGPPGGRPVGDP